MSAAPVLCSMFQVQAQVGHQQRWQAVAAVQQAQRCQNAEERRQARLHQPDELTANRLPWGEGAGQKAVPRMSGPASSLTH